VRGCPWSFLSRRLSISRSNSSYIFSRLLPEMSELSPLPHSSWPPCSSFIALARIYSASVCYQDLGGGLVRGLISAAGYEVKHSRIKGKVLVESCWTGDGLPIFSFSRCANSICSEVIVSVYISALCAPPRELYWARSSSVPSRSPCETAAAGWSCVDAMTKSRSALVLEALTCCC
jgi:hypothetical protein